MPKPVAAMEVPVPDFSETPLKKTKIQSLVSKRDALKAKIKAMEEEARELSDSILNLLIRYDVKSAVVDHYRVTVADGCHSSLSKDKLLELGVTPKVLQKAIVRKEYTYLMVTDLNAQKKEKEE